MALGIEVLFALLTVSGLAYLLIALWSARDFVHFWQRRGALLGHAAAFAPGVSILKPVKGVDARMYAGFMSHCRQELCGSVRDRVWRKLSG